MSGPASLTAVQRASQGHSAKLASGERSRVEAAGIEPASRDISTTASTCIVDYLF